MWAILNTTWNEEITPVFPLLTLKTTCIKTNTNLGYLHAVGLCTILAQEIVTCKINPRTQRGAVYPPSGGVNKGNKGTVPIDLVQKTYVSRIRDWQSVSNTTAPYTHYITFVQYSAKSWNTVIWTPTTCTVVYVYQYFGETSYYFFCQGRWQKHHPSQCWQLSNNYTTSHTQNSNSYSHSVGGKPKTLIANSSNKTFNKSTEVIFGDKMSAAL